MRKPEPDRNAEAARNADIAKLGQYVKCVKLRKNHEWNIPRFKTSLLEMDGP